MKKAFFVFACFLAATAAQAQAPAGSKLAAEQAFVKELNRIFDYAKEHPATGAYPLIKAPTLGHTGLLTLTFGYTENGSSCREVATIAIDKAVEIIVEPGVALQAESEGVQRVKLCNGQQPTSLKENRLLMGSFADTVMARSLATGLETALRRLQTFYK